MVKVHMDRWFYPQRKKELKTIYKYYNLPGRKGYYLDRWIKTNFDNYIIRGVERGWDGVILITGIEGSGKSTTAFTYAHYCDPTFPGKPRVIDEEGTLDPTGRKTVDRIVFTFQQFAKCIDDSQPGQSIVFDEFVMAGLSSDAMTKMQRLLIKKMTLIRKKRLYIFLVIPSIFMLRRYFAIFRTRALLHHFTPDGISRGKIKVYGYDRKRQLFMAGQKKWNMRAAAPNFIGDSMNTAGYFFDLNDYEKKKDEAIKSLTKETDKNKSYSKTSLAHFVATRRYYICLKFIYEYLNEINQNRRVTYKDFVKFIRAKVNGKFVNVWWDLKAGKVSNYIREIERIDVQKNDKKNLDNLE